MDANDNIVWQYVTDTNSRSVAAPLPTRAVRFRDGDTLIRDQFDNRVIRVSSTGQIVASYGLPLAGGGAIGIMSAMTHTLRKRVCMRLTKVGGITPG